MSEILCKMTKIFQRGVLYIGSGYAGLGFGRGKADREYWHVK